MIVESVCALLCESANRHLSEGRREERHFVFDSIPRFIYLFARA